MRYPISAISAPLLTKPRSEFGDSFITNSKLGIDIIAPESLLHLYGGDSGVAPNAESQLFIEDSGNAGISIHTGTSSIAYLYFGDSGDNDAGGFIYDNGSDHIKFRTGGADRILLNASGNFGKCSVAVIVI